MLMNWIRILRMRLKGWKIGKRVIIGKNCIFKADYIEIGDDSTIGNNCVIIARNIVIGNNCLIFPHFHCLVNFDFLLGSRSKISRNATFHANSIKIGEELWCNENTEVGGGGWKKDTANLTIGDSVHIGKDVSINVCKPVVIGSFTGIGIGSMIFTHSSGNGQSILDGYKHVEDAVRIGNHVSIFTRAIISPGSHVEDGVTLAAMSFFSGVSEANGMYAGIPAVMKKKVYPTPIEKRISILFEALQQEDSQLFKVSINGGLKGHVLLIDELDDETVRMIIANEGTTVITLRSNCRSMHNVVIFDIENQIVNGRSNEISEKARDALRRNGILFSYGSYVPCRLSYKNLLQEGIERL